MGKTQFIALRTTPLQKDASRGSTPRKSTPNRCGDTRLSEDPADAKSSHRDVTHELGLILHLLTHQKTTPRCLAGEVAAQGPTNAEVPPHAGTEPCCRAKILQRWWLPARPSLLPPPLLPSGRHFLMSSRSHPAQEAAACVPHCHPKRNLVTQALKQSQLPLTTLGHSSTLRRGQGSAGLRF